MKAQTDLSELEVDQMVGLGESGEESGRMVVLLHCSDRGVVWARLVFDKPAMRVSGNNNAVLLTFSQSMLDMIVGKKKLSKRQLAS